jgi:hypothetical protein
VRADTEAQFLLPPEAGLDRPTHHHPPSPHPQKNIFRRNVGIVGESVLYLQMLTPINIMTTALSKVSSGSKNLWIMYAKGLQTLPFRVYRCTFLGKQVNYI